MRNPSYEMSVCRATEHISDVKRYRIVLPELPIGDFGGSPPSTFASGRSTRTPTCRHARICQNRSNTTAGPSRNTHTVAYSPSAQNCARMSRLRSPYQTPAYELQLEPAGESANMVLFRTPRRQLNPRHASERLHRDITPPNSDGDPFRTTANFVLASREAIATEGPLSRGDERLSAAAGTVQCGGSAIPRSEREATGW